VNLVKRRLCRSVGFADTLRMRYGVFGCLALWSGLAFANGHAAPNSWSGTWRLDQHLSQPVGPSFIYAQASTGEFTVNAGDHVYRFFCDGKDYPTLPQHSLVCTQAGPRRMQMIYKVNGQAVRVGAPRQGGSPRPGGAADG
jgi:hypothetical protein